MSAEPRVIAVFNTYDGLLDGLRARAAERKLALSSDENATIAGLPDKYLPKLIGSNPIRRLGMGSLGAVAGVLAVKFVMVEDEEAERRLRMLAKRYNKSVKTRNDRLVRDDVTVVRLTRRHMKKIGARGKELRWKRATKEERAAVARELNRIRWSKPRVVEVK
jgi:hypothetical protein